MGDLDINKIGPRHIEKVLTTLAEEQYRPGTILRFFGVLKAALNDARRLGKLNENPESRVKPPKVNNVLVRYLTTGQEATLLGKLPQKYLPVTITAVNAGCRQGELLRLKWVDVDWNAGILTIRETKAGGFSKDSNEFNRPRPPAQYAEIARSCPSRPNLSPGCTLSQKNL